MDPRYIDTLENNTLSIAHLQEKNYEIKEVLITTKKCYFVDLIIMVLSTFE